MAHQPRVSVLIPAFRAEEFVREAVASVLAQTYDHLEVLLIPDDGGSYDHIRDEFPTSRLRVLPPAGQGTGCGPSRNRGIDASTGEFFALCDADDLWPSNYLETLVPLAATAGAACAVTHYTDWAGTVIRRPPVPPGVVSISGYAQQLSSLRPVVHRRVEPGYLHVYAQDVLHDLQVIAELGGQVPMTADTHYVLRERPGSLTNSGKSNEVSLHQAYVQHAHAARWHPTSLGLQRLVERDRVAIADAFEFRSFVSRAFEQSHQDSYHRFVSGRESRLWDDFNAQRYLGGVPERRRASLHAVPDRQPESVR